MILVTEVNAGFVVLRGSNHAPPLLEADWQSIPLGPGDMQDRAIGKYRQMLVSAYWQLVSKMISHRRDDRDMTPTECHACIQTGAHSLLWSCHEHLPRVGCGLVTGGRMDTRTVFLPPKGDWPRQGHPKALVSPYDLLCSRGHEHVLNRDPSLLCVKTTHERCGPFSLVVLSQRRGRVTTLSGQTLSETLSSKASAKHIQVS